VSSDRDRSLGGLAAIGLAGNAGCLTVILIIGAILIGRWLDGLLGTRPWLMLGLILVSIPLSLYVMVQAALSAGRQRSTPGTPASPGGFEEDDVWQEH
jgi:F0F1-type ATP synthase assembly protein I